MPAQFSPRGLFRKSRVDVGAQQLTDGTTYLNLNNGIRISGARVLSANSTAFVAGTTESAIPTTDEGAAFTIGENSTGVFMAINSTGTTWKYLNTTSVQPT